MLEFYPNLNHINAGFNPRKIDSQTAQTASLPVIVNNNLNNNVSQTMLPPNNNENNGNITPNGPTPATAPTLSNCVGQTGKYKSKI